MNWKFLVAALLGSMQHNAAQFLHDAPEKIQGLLSELLNSLKCRMLGSKMQVMLLRRMLMQLPECPWHFLRCSLVSLDRYRSPLFILTK